MTLVDDVGSLLLFHTWIGSCFVHFDNRGHKKPYQVQQRIKDGGRKSLGYYATREEAEAVANDVMQGNYIPPPTGTITANKDGIIMEEETKKKLVGKVFVIMRGR